MVKKSVKPALPSFVKLGSSAIDELLGESKFLRLVAGKPVDVVALTGMEGVISFNQHDVWLDKGNSPHFPCFGASWCPGEIIGVKSKFRGLFLCMIKDDPNQKEMILSLGISLFKGLVACEEALGMSLRGQILRIKRAGEGLSTTYTVVPTGRKVKLNGEPETNLIDHIGAQTPEEVIKQLVAAEVWLPEHQSRFDSLIKFEKMRIEDEDDDNDDDEVVVVTPPPVKSKAKIATIVKPVVEEEDDEDESEDDDEEPVVKKSKAKPVVEEEDDEDESEDDDDDEGDDFENIDEDDED